MILGLDNAGKTSILKRIAHPEEKIDQNFEVWPTYGFNISTYELNNTILNIWDIGGQKAFRSFWSTYVDQSDAIVFVIDSADEKNLSESGKALMSILDEDSLDGVPLLILANKCDLVGSSLDTVDVKILLIRLKICFR